MLRCQNENCEHYPRDKPPPVECGQTVLIWGDHFGAADTAERLGYLGHQVYVVTQDREFAPWMEPCHRDVMLKRFAGRNGEGLKGKTYAHPVRIIPISAVLEITPEGRVVLLNNRFEKSTVQADTSCWPRSMNDELYETLLEAGLKVVRSATPTGPQLRGAVTDGANAALAIEADAVLNANLELVSNLPSEIMA